MASLSTARTDPRLNLRGWWRIALLVLTLAILLIPHIVLRLIGFRKGLSSQFLDLGARAIGIDVKVVGTPLSRHVLFVSNHLSWMDIFVLGGTARTAFVAKSEIKDWPFIGWLAGQNRTVFIAREDRRSVGSQADQLREALAAAYPVALFPEGTTGEGNRLLPFRPALLAAAAPGPAHLSIQPVALDYGPDPAEYAWTDDEPTGDNIKRLLSRRGRHRVVAHFLEPLDAQQAGDRKLAAAAAQAAIEQALFGSADKAFSRAFRGRAERL